MQERRQQNLCYNCDEKWSAQHKCKNRPHLLMVEFEDEGNSVTEIGLFPPGAEGVDTAVSFHAMARTPSYTIFRFTGFIGYVQVLLDGAGTHSFICSTVAQHLNLPVEPTTSFTVAVGNRERLHTEGKIAATRVSIQGHEFQLELFVLAIHGADVILGASWLSTLGWVRQNYDQLVLEFEVDGRTIRWTGEPRCVPQPAHLHYLQKLYQANEVMESFQVDIRPTMLTGQGNTAGPTAGTDDAVSSILEQFWDVFQVPQGLPPARAVDHAIPLRLGLSPINIRPYRYPYFHKGIIETMVKDMLKEGVIQPSCSPFSWC